MGIDGNVSLFRTVVIILVPRFKYDWFYLQKQSQLGTLLVGNQFTRLWNDPILSFTTGSCGSQSVKWILHDQWTKQLWIFFTIVMHGWYSTVSLYIHQQNISASKIYLSTKYIHQQNISASKIYPPVKYI